MPSRRTRTVSLVAFALAAIVAACGGSADGGKKKNAGKEEVAGTTEGSGSGGEGKVGGDGNDEFVKGDKPVDVAGSWLIDCDLGRKVDDQHTEVGCNTQDAATLALTTSATASDWTVIDEAKKKVEVARLEAATAGGGRYEVVFKMPIALVATASISATRSDKPGQVTQPMRTLFGLSPGQVQCLVSKPSLDCILNDPLTPGTAKTSLAFDGLVDANFIDLPIIGNATGATVGTYCNDKGIAAPLLFGVLGGPKKETRQVELDGDTCFARFDTAAQALSDKFFTDLYRYDGAFLAGPKRKSDGAPYCFFVLLGKKGQSGTRLHIMHNAATLTGATGGASAADLLATVLAHRCK